MPSNYCTIANVKERLDITIADYDTELTSAIQEAADYIDASLRQYLSYRQTVTLKEADYVNCISSDIGKQVLDDEVEVGELLNYNNTTRIWKIRTTSTIAINSELKIAGRLRGEASGASTDDITETENPYFVFKTLPLVALIPNQIKVICGDLAAGIYLRRKEPEDFDTGWWNQGIYKLTIFLKGNFRGVVIFA